eukprot:5000094-Pyramimonas_sp.AAC.1
MGTRRFDVAHQPMKACITRGIPFACQVENLHQYTRRVLAEDTLVGVVGLGKRGALDAKSLCVG